MKEFIVRTFGWVKVKITRSCQHGRHSDVVLAGNAKVDFAYCSSCGLRTPDMPHDDYAIAQKMLVCAETNGVAFRDLQHLSLIATLNKHTNTISKPFLIYSHEKD